MKNLFQPPRVIHILLIIIHSFSNGTTHIKTSKDQ